MAELLVVATPIGNLNDLSPRMAEALSCADLIAAEDTRVTMKLLHHLGITKPMVSCHRHNEARRAKELIERMLAEDLTVAYASDAGTPGISDPGVVLVRAAHEAGIRVTPICGPTALAAALSASGFDAREFVFLGFLPREKKPLRQRLEALQAQRVPVAVAYESPHRVLDLVKEIARAMPGARLSVCCDLSKKFELILVGACEELLVSMQANPNVEKGEYVVVIEVPPAPEQQQSPAPLSAELCILQSMMEGAGLQDAARRALDQGHPRNEVYRARLSIKNRFDLEE